MINMNNFHMRSEGKYDVTLYVDYIMQRSADTTMLNIIGSKRSPDDVASSIYQTMVDDIIHELYGDIKKQLIELKLMMFDDGLHHFPSSEKVEDIIRSLPRSAYI